MVLLQMVQVLQKREDQISQGMDYDLVGSVTDSISFQRNFKKNMRKHSTLLGKPFARDPNTAECKNHLLRISIILLLLNFRESQGQENISVTQCTRKLSSVASLQRIHFGMTQIHWLHLLCLDSPVRHLTLARSNNRWNFLMSRTNIIRLILRTTKIRGVINNNFVAHLSNG